MLNLFLIETMKKLLACRSVNWAVFFLVITFTLFSCHQKKYSNNSPVAVVPASSPLFIRINDLPSFTQSFDNQNNWWSIVGRIQNIKPFQDNLAVIDSFINTNTEFKSFIKGKEIVISFIPGEKNSFEPLIIVPVDANGEQKKAESFINGWIKKKHLGSVKRKIERENIYTVKNSDAEPLFCYTVKHGFLFFGKNYKSLLETTHHLETTTNNQDAELAPLLKTTNNQAQINIFINHQLAQNILSVPLSDLMRERNIAQKDYSGWSELDATIKGDKIILSGFTNGNSSKNYFASILQNQQPGSSKIETVLPANTLYFSDYYISDIQKFFTDLNSFQSLKNNSSQHQDQQKQIENKTGIDLQKLFIEIFDGEMARSSLSLNTSDQASGLLFIVKTKSGSYTLNKILQLIHSYQSDKIRHSSDWVKEFKIDNQTSYKIYKFPFSNLISLLFGDLFADIETNWFTIYDNSLLLSDSYDAIGKVILSNMLGETLMADNDYSKFHSGLSSKNNYYFYCNTSLCFDTPSLLFNDTLSKDISANDEFRKFKHFSWQISSASNMVYNNSSIIFDQNSKLKPQTVWQSRLAAPLAFKPLIIQNKYDLQDNEIVLFDTNNNLYMLNNVGRILWQMNTGSPILGEINLIDLHDNGDHQFVFNTKEKLYILDRKGNAVKNFPVNFKVSASNGVSVFDYEKNHNFRFFFASDDQVIYAYDQDGKPLDGWQTNKTDYLVTKPIQHFSVEGKDYIVASDRMKDYIFDRKGNVRVQTDFVYQHSGNNTLYLEKRTSQHEPRLVSSDAEGNIHRTYFNGNHETIGFNQLDDNHWFIVANADEDEEMEYIFTGGDHIYVQKNVGRNLFNLKLDEKNLDKPSVYCFSSKEKKIGVSSPSANKIYLFNNNGSLYKGFPLDGCTGFSIGFINDDHSRFNLYVGSPDGYLYNYLVE